MGRRTSGCPRPAVCWPARPLVTANGHTVVSHDTSGTTRQSAHTLGPWLPLCFLARSSSWLRQIVIMATSDRHHSYVSSPSWLRQLVIMATSARPHGYVCASYLALMATSVLPVLPSWLRHLAFIATSARFHSYVSSPSWLCQLAFMATSARLHSYVSSPSWLRQLAFMATSARLHGYFSSPS